MKGSNTDPGAARYQLEVALLHLAQAAEGHRLHLKLTLPDHIQHFEQRPETICCEVSYQKLILSFWGDTYAQSWQVVSFTSTLNRIELQVSRQSGRLMGSLLIQVDLADHLLVPPERQGQD
ncbi:MAG TPA: hypothetical protein PKZ53_18030, partial [Acidobacteriota bacterium]|nr:hypothetical protein [Acidobacteriota bacterium]